MAEQLTRQERLSEVTEVPAKRLRIPRGAVEAAARFR
jgi:hypothetical protein